MGLMDLIDMQALEKWLEVTPMEYIEDTIDELTQAKSIVHGVLRYLAYEIREENMQQTIRIQVSKKPENWEEMEWEDLDPRPERAAKLRALKEEYNKVKEVMNDLKNWGSDEVNEKLNKLTE